MPCIDEESALALVEGRSVPADVRQHLAGCEVCRAFVAGLARVMVPDLAGDRSTQHPVLERVLARPDDAETTSAIARDGLLRR